jgi:hypothetical protein
MKIFKKKQIPISDCPTSILRVFQKSRLDRHRYHARFHRRRLFPLGIWLQQLERQKSAMGNNRRTRHLRGVYSAVPKIYAASQSKLIVREILRRSGSIRTDHNGMVILRWRWLKKVYSWTVTA